VARQRLGKPPAWRVGGHRRVGRLVEAEAYLDPHGLASPSARGRTPRNATPSGLSGHAGIKLNDGVDHCPSAVTGPEGYAATVPTRALQPVGNTKAPGVDRLKVGLDLHGAELSPTEPERHVPLGAVARPRSGARSASARADELLLSSS
jgi:3-methyladenine DNA glycosylase Mpg